MLVDTINKVKNVSIGYVGSDGLFDSATVNAYTASLRGLSEIPFGDVHFLVVFYTLVTGHRTRGRFYCNYIPRQENRPLVFKASFDFKF